MVATGMRRASATFDCNSEFWPPNMPQVPPSQLALPYARYAWRSLDWIVASALFAATAGVVLWQNAHVAVLWDLQMASQCRAHRHRPNAVSRLPVHAPLTFLIQAAIIRLAGSVYFHHALYVAAVGGLGSVLAWRLAFHTLQGTHHVRLDGRVAPGRAARSAWALLHLSVAFLWTAIVRSGCCCRAMAVREADLADTDLPPASRTPARIRCGSNVLLAALLQAEHGIAVFGCHCWLGSGSSFGEVPPPKTLCRSEGPSVRSLLATLAGTVAALLVAALLLHLTAGIGNYIDWDHPVRRATTYAGIQGYARRPTFIPRSLGCFRALLLLWRYCSPGFGNMGLGANCGLCSVGRTIFFSLASLMISDDIDERGDTFLGFGLCCCCSRRRWPSPICFVRGAILTCAFCCPSFSWSQSTAP